MIAGFYIFKSVMKKLLFLLFFVLSAGLIQAQRFFYVEPGNASENQLKARLLKASQFVVKSPLMSDYTIKTETQFRAGYPATVKIILQDSVTFQTIFQTNEEYRFGEIRTDPQRLLDMAMQILIKRNINRIILCAKNDHVNTLLKAVEFKKDKT
jgi:hypothetical protein